MNNSNNTNSTSVGFFGFLALIFITLKLLPDSDGHIIDWSWWWVLSPIWIPLAIVVLILLGLWAYVVVKQR